MFRCFERIFKCRCVGSSVGRCMPRPATESGRDAAKRVFLIIRNFLRALMRSVGD